MSNPQTGEPRFRVRLPEMAVSWTPSVGQCFAPGGQYAWFVRALGEEWGEWSEAKVFEVASGPSIAEVEEAMRVLRRFNGDLQSRALSQGEVPAEMAQWRERVGPGGHSALVERALRQAPDPEAAPTLGPASLTVDGQVHLGGASSIFKDGELFLWDDEEGNSGVGREALAANTMGLANTASGWRALASNTTGSGNTAVGMWALRNNSTGNTNTAVGMRALRYNTTGRGNTANGLLALYANTTGIRNTATGSAALASNTTGSYNTASGYLALVSNETGFRNTAGGYATLAFNSTGDDNTATGFRALYSNTTGNRNTASGKEALFSNTTGYRNTAGGYEALFSNTTGSFNTAIGYKALYNNISGSSNVAIGTFAGAFSTGDGNVIISHRGLAGDTNTIRLGEFQTRAFIAGVWGSTLTGSTVLVSSSGQLGVAPSARRFKQDIQEMGEASSGLLALPPVTFRYRPEVVEGPRPVEFGLLAEEVAELYPDLVTYDDEGRPFTVRYQALIPLLLNELQKQHQLNQQQERELELLKSHIVEAEGDRPSLASGRR